MAAKKTQFKLPTAEEAKQIYLDKKEDLLVQSMEHIGLCIAEAATSGADYVVIPETKFMYDHYNDIERILKEKGYEVYQKNTSIVSEKPGDLKITWRH